MRKKQTTSFNYDALIIGSGIAGLVLAQLLAQKGMSVLLACKGQLIDSNTSYAQGGLAAVTGANPVDSAELHLKDTLSSGAGLTDESVARAIVSRGGDLISMLDQLGVNFDKHSGVHDVALEGGHSRARVLHSKDASGRAISTSLIDVIRQHQKITIWQNAFASELIVTNGRCNGALFAFPDRTSNIVTAAHTVLATGGIGQIFSRTTNPVIATGDGIAMAYRAGARLIDMEFVQFHPTALSLPGTPADLISEAIRGAGATLLDQQGSRFAFRFHKDGELATRDIVARAIYTTMMEQETDAVMLDMRPIGASAIAEKFPNIFKKCIERGFDPRVTPIPVAPAAHYFMGGIWTDVSGKTSLDGLYAIGESASTGLHGANRLASNSLLEGGVMAIELSNTISGANIPFIISRDYAAAGKTSAVENMVSIDDFRQSMFRCVGLERDNAGLLKIAGTFDSAPSYCLPATRKAGERQNITLLGWLIACSALARKESRGSHWRTDYPRANDGEFLKRYYVSQTSSGWMDVSTTPFVGPRIQAAV